jgi:hypothetical protein
VKHRYCFSCSMYAFFYLFKILFQPSQTTRKLSAREQRDCEVIGKLVCLSNSLNNFFIVFLLLLVLFSYIANIIYIAFIMLINNCNVLYILFSNSMLCVLKVSHFYLKSEAYTLDMYIQIQYKTWALYCFCFFKCWASRLKIYITYRFIIWNNKPINYRLFYQ